MKIPQSLDTVSKTFTTFEYIKTVGSFHTSQSDNRKKEVERYNNEIAERKKQIVSLIDETLSHINKNNPSVTFIKESVTFIPKEEEDTKRQHIDYYIDIKPKNTVMKIRSTLSTLRGSEINNSSKIFLSIDLDKTFTSQEGDIYDMINMYEYDEENKQKEVGYDSHYNGFLPTYLEDSETVQKSIVKIADKKTKMTLNNPQLTSDQGHHAQGIKETFNS